MSALSSSRRAGIVDGLEAGLAEFQLGFLEGAREAFVLAGAPLGIDEQGEALVEAEGGELRIRLLGGPGGGQGRELEGLELLEGLAIEHRSILLRDERVRGRRTSTPLLAGKAGEGLGASRSAFLEGGHIPVSPYGAEISPVGTRASPLAGGSW